MDKHLYFICPSDHLEATINKTYKQENYFCTSLANSLSFDDKTITCIRGLIESKHIFDITFVLATDNPVVKDALIGHHFSNINGLSKFNQLMYARKQRFGLLIQKKDLSYSMLNYHLHVKVNELRKTLQELWFAKHIKIDAKLYNREQHHFRQANLNTFYKESFSLN
jgi:hypothetical protein